MSTASAAITDTNMPCCFVRMDPTTPLLVDLGERSYFIYTGPHLLPRAGELIRDAVSPLRCFIITHPIIERLHGDSLRRGFGSLSLETILVPAGERQKSLRRAARVYDKLLAAGADRCSVLVALGGGVIGDLTGFVAATYMRGIAYVQVPTTLLAQVDASVGGKVAVNHPRAKNLIGAFHQPRLVIADSSALQTLGGRDYRAGIAEVIKHAITADADLFNWLQRDAALLAGRDSSAVAYAVRRSCEIKAEVVRKDELEAGPRAALNLGHTVGHALEALAGYSHLRHGEAVAIGMVAAARIAVALGMLPAAAADEMESLLNRFRLPTRTPAFHLDQVVAIMQSDKKAAAGAPRFVLPTAIGAVKVGVEVPREIVAEVLLSLGAIP